MVKCPIVILEWEDAATYSNKSYHDIAKDKPLIVRTFGILFKTPKYYIIMTHDGDDDSSDFVRVPKSLARKIIPLNGNLR